MPTGVPDIGPILKIIYRQGLPLALYKESPLVGLMTKETNFYGSSGGGEGFRYAVRVSGTPGASSDFAEALENVGTSLRVRFTMERRRDYSIVEVETEALRAASNDEGALVDLVKDKSAAAVYAITQSIARSAYGDGSGRRGVIDAGGGTNVLTLANVPGVASQNDIVGFEAGMWVVPADADGANPGTKRQISRVDRVNATITTAGAPFDAGEFAAGRHLFRSGDINQMPEGLDAILPATVSDTDNFRGVNRSFDRTRLAGIPYVASQGNDSTIERALMNAYGFGGRENARPTHVFGNPIAVTHLANELGAKVKYDRIAGKGEDGKALPFGYNSLMMLGIGGDGALRIIPDHNCPLETMYMLKLSDWRFKTLGSAPGVVNDKGNPEWRTMEGADAVQKRLGYFGNFYTPTPYENIRVDISDVLPQ